MFDKTIQEVKNELYEEVDFEDLWSRDKDGDFKERFAKITLMITPTKNIYKIELFGSKKDDEFYNNLTDLKKRMKELIKQNGDDSK